MTAPSRNRASGGPPPRQGLYDPAFERDACGVGFIGRIDGEASREVVDLALAALKSVWHRGAVGADGKTGDGAGLMIDIPQAFFEEQVARTGHHIREGGLCVGMMFLPRTNLTAQERARTIVEAEILRAGAYLYGWRQAPVDLGAIGERAAEVRPEIEQVMFHLDHAGDDAARERALYLLRRRMEKRAAEEGLADFYVCSLSGRTIIYKGMFLAEQIDRFYPDLTDERFTSRLAIFHQRYSTNTFPQWKLAQPFRTLAHNGEINTLSGNTRWMRVHERELAKAVEGGDTDVIRPVIAPGASDSAALDAAFELLLHTGRDAPMTKALLIPEAWSKRDDVMPAARRAMYAYCNTLMEPWDGPAAVCATDGRWAVAGLDRNGLRPLRYARTADGLVVVGSETGITPLDPERIVERGAVPAGQMIGLDLQEGRFFGPDALLDALAANEPFEKLAAGVRRIDEEVRGPSHTEKPLEGDRLRRLQTAVGYNREIVDLILRPMGEEAREAVGSMGDDAPLAVLSDAPRPLAHFFRQNFSQVTNPPIDPLREERVMSLKTRFQNLADIWAKGDGTEARARRILSLESPILKTADFERLRGALGDAAKKIDMTFDAADGEPEQALRGALDRMRDEARAAAREGREVHVFLDDDALGPDRAGVPAILAVAAIHQSLLEEGLRAGASVNVRAADVVDPHGVACLIGCGATTVNPYLAEATLMERREAGALSERGAGDVADALIAALEKGLLKIMSKSGISVVSSYRGGLNFEALGLSRGLVDEFFPGMPTRISGLGLAGIARGVIERHKEAFGHERATPLPAGGFYRLNARGEAHAQTAETIKLLQRACDEDDEEAYLAYAERVDQKPRAVELRDLMAISPLGPPRSDNDGMESLNAIRKRFVTPGMSLGALSPEAHGVLNIAMNRIGAKSTSGEGGEDPDRYAPLPNGDNADSAIKQIASGRFGVTARYLNQCREIEIKVAQGAKPGEGGQLPGFKVTDLVAKFRHATPGVTLISPPPHHDIYSIEDLAQLIYDLKQINPDARVCVKLVAKSGIGAVAAGVAKAKADVIHISGHSGGTGASPQSSIKHAGLPWEIGLAEANQTLRLNGLRGDVRLRVDGGLRTGRDIIIAALLGGEEFGIGTASLIALGCLLVRQCHSNTCPVGICTQDEDLRRHFRGRPEQVVRLMTFIAKDVRRRLADMGATSISDIVGRADLLAQASRGAEHLDDLDFNPLLMVAGAPEEPREGLRRRRETAPTLDDMILADAAPAFERMEKMQVDYVVRNTDRTVGARVSSKIVRTFGEDGVGDGHLTVRLTGAAGQSLGAFGAKGLLIDLVGDANDYVGKGLSGAEIRLRPPRGAAYEAARSAILGNTALYGATSGRLFAAGRAGERFAVRNSGAHAVVEGCGANGCEYMTGGRVFILGPVGDNFAAGMTGGFAFVAPEDPDAFDKHVNGDSVRIFDLPDGPWAEEARAMVAAHQAATGSLAAEELLKEWDVRRADIRLIAPKDMVDRLPFPLPANDARRKTG